MKPSVGRFLFWSVPAGPLRYLAVLHRTRLRPRTHGIGKEVGCDYFSPLRKIEVPSDCGERPYLDEGGCGGVGSCIRLAMGMEAGPLLEPSWRSMLALLLGPAGAWRGEESSPTLMPVTAAAGG
jgi:hypothetical protein